MLPYPNLFSQLPTSPVSKKGSQELWSHVGEFYLITLQENKVKISKYIIELNLTKSPKSYLFCVSTSNKQEDL